MDAPGRHRNRSSLAVALSVIAIVCSLAAFWFTTKQRRHSDEPSLVADNTIIDPNSTSPRWNVSVLISNHGDQEARNVWIDARVAMPNDTTVSHSVIPIKHSRLGSQPPSAQTIVTGMMPDHVRDAIAEGNADLFLIVDLRYMDTDGDSLHYSTIERYDREAKRFLIATRFKEVS